MIELYLKLQETLLKKDAYTAAKLKAARHYDLYRGQYETPERFELFKTPAIFVEFRINWEANQSSNKGRMEIVAHVVTEGLADTSNTNFNQLKGLDILKYHTVIKQLIEGLESEDTGKIRCINEEPRLFGVLNSYMITFECSIAKKTSSKYTGGGIDEIIIEHKKFIMPE